MSYNKRIFILIQWKQTQGSYWQDSTGTSLDNNMYVGHNSTKLSHCRYWKKEVRRKLGGLPTRLWMVLAQCIWWRLILQGFLIAIEVQCPIHGFKDSLL